MRSYIKGALAVALSFSATACLDLTVVNENNPDIERALSDPADVEQVIASSFIIYMQTFNSTDISRPFTQLSDEMTTTITTRAVHWAQEPREPFNNDPNGDLVWMPRRSWDNFSECIANTNDGLRQIANGMQIRTLDTGGTVVADNTDRAYVFAKLMQGLCTGMLAAMHDKVAIARETDNMQLGYEDLLEWERNNFKDYKAMTAMAVKSLEEAIARADAAPETFQLPNTWINQKTYTREELVQVAHTLIARFLVASARTPAERAAVDWQKVLHHTERGLTFDFGPTLQAGIVNQANWLGLVTATSSEFRMDNDYMGQADQSGQYADWLATPFDERTPFFMITTDRRVTAAPATTCTNPDPAAWVPSTATANNGRRGDQCSPNGAYFRNRNTLTNFSTARSTGYQALYQWYRRNNSGYSHIPNAGAAPVVGGGFVSNTGHYTIVSADENRLLRAEAFLRTGNVQEAVNLINVTRTRGVRIGTTVIASNLPPIPATNSAATLVPATPYTVVGRTYQSCVPRSHKDPAQCGNVWDALVWERKMEMMGQDPVRWMADARSLGLLKEGTLIQWPIPGRYIVGLKIPVYTFGGKGQDGSAPPYNPAW